MNERFVLGADDPEMKVIGGLLAAHCISFSLAAVGDKRCHPGNAYSADGVLPVGGTGAQPLREPYDGLVFVECKPGDVPSVEKHSRLTVLDHHEEGDPGYGRGPEDFWLASSLGQVAVWLETSGRQVDITQEMRIIAAMDHCRQAAIRGECPGVSQEEIITQRVASIAARHNLRAESVMGIIGDYAARFSVCETAAFGNGQVIDFTHEHLGIGYSVELLCAQTTLDISGLTALIRNCESDSPSDEKVLLTGHATPEMVEYFIKVYAPAKNLQRIFGVPQRGYAGGYVARDSGSHSDPILLR